MRLPDPQGSQLVLIGASRYEDNKLPNLPAVERSIKDLAAAFIDPINGLVPEDHCTILVNEGDIRLIGRRLRLAARKAKDLLMVYYAGHGLVGGRRHDLYLGLPDSEWVEPEFNSLEYDKLRTAVLDSPAKAKVIILDCCFSGRVVTDTMADTVSTVIGQVEVDGTYVLASAPRDQLALVLKGEHHTAFTGRLLNILENGMPDGPEYLTLDRLYQQLADTMRAEGLPHPQRRGTDSAGLIALARNRAYSQREDEAITVSGAMDELNEMIGLEAAKDQVVQIVTSVEATRRRAMAGYTVDRPMQDFAFLGPPGSGKLSMAKVIAKVFYAYGLLETPTVVEASHADLFGEYLGVTAIKTNELIDSALGAVLFISEAYRLLDGTFGSGDRAEPRRFGYEAVRAIAKRAKSDRNDIIIILAGSENEMEGFLDSSPELASLFATRIRFATYTSSELMSFAELCLEQRGELLDPDARSPLWRMMEDVSRRGLTDKLGNSRFVRGLLERAGRVRDVRVMQLETEPTQRELVTLEASDLERAWMELTAPFRGNSEGRLV